jgi:tetratricopeptide (TPR) repeat protein
LNIAKAAINRNDYTSGIECYEKILEIDPTNNEAKFLLRRAKYMTGEEKPEGGVDEEADKSESDQSEPESKPAQPAMLAQQHMRSISIKPKQQFEVNRNIIGPDTEKVYGVETDDISELEEVSKDAALKIKAKDKRKNKPVRIIIFCLGVLFGLILMLWYFGYL